MILETTRFGKIELDDKDAIVFPDGIPGFPEARRFVLLQHSPQSPFHWLQNLEDGALAFLVIDPLLVDEDYLGSIPEEELRELGIGDVGEAAVLSIVRVHREARKVTANLLAPLLINPKTRRGKQVILMGSRYEMRHDLTALSTDSEAEVREKPSFAPQG